MSDYEVKCNLEMVRFYRRQAKEAWSSWEREYNERLARHYAEQLPVQLPLLPLY